MPNSAIAILFAGLIFRLILAFVLLPGSGHTDDIEQYARWGMTLAIHGPGEFYVHNDFADYPPGYLYVLWLLATMSRVIASVAGTDALRTCVLLIKIPSMLFDLLTAVVLHKVARYWHTQPGAAHEHIPLKAAALYVFNPTVLYDSAIWGQSDAAGAFIMVLGVLALLRWPPEVAASVGIAAAMLKPQFGVVLIPLISIVLLRRHATPRGDSAPIFSFAYWTRQDGPIRILTSAAVSLAVFYLLVAPFNMTLTSFVHRIITAAQFYDFLTVNAFNPWAIVSPGGNSSLLVAGVDTWSHDNVPMLGSLTGVEVGASILAFGFLVGAARLLWRSDRLSIALVGLYLCMCFYILPTRVHERYIFPAFAFAALLGAVDRRWLWATVALTLGSLMNFHAVLSKDGTENIARLPFGTFLRSPTGILISITLQTAVFLFAVWRLRPNACGVSSARISKTVSSQGMSVHCTPQHLGDVDL